MKKSNVIKQYEEELYDKTPWRRAVRYKYRKKNGIFAYAYASVSLSVGVDM
jgi:hypothetical protein